MLDGRTAAWPQVEELARNGCVAVLPFGAFEQHGPHMPLSTDTIMAQELARRLAERLTKRLTERLAGAAGALLLPPVHYGETSGNNGFPGTISLGFDTVRHIALDICAGLRQGGVAGLVVVNGDYGNQAPLKLAAREARDQLGYPVLVIDYPGLAEIAAQVSETPSAGHGFYHADEVETSMVLAIEPTAVRMEHAREEYPRFPAAYGCTPIPLREISASGVFGDPRRATAAKGARILDELTERAWRIVEPFTAEVTAPALSPHPHSWASVSARTSRN
jgi:creatinine amidohydrolase